ncbi:MAG: RidA family protein [Opitutales bacterium]|nr:RidA family protein [Opitutales bacterium]
MTTKRVIKGEGIPGSYLPFSPALAVGDYLFVSGQASVDLKGNIIRDSFESECRRSIENLRRVLEGAGIGLSDVVQVRCYVDNPQDLNQFNRIYSEYFSEPHPARTTLIGCLGGVLGFEIDAVAYLGK